MPDLNNINPDFFKPYMMILKCLSYSGINVLDETRMWIMKFKYIHIFSFTICLIMTSSHWCYIFNKLAGGSDLIDLAVDLSFCYDALQVLVLFFYMCVIKNRMQKFIFKLEKEWRYDSDLLPHVSIFKRKHMDDFECVNYKIHILIQTLRYFYMGFPIVVTLVKKYILRQEVVYTTPLQFIMPFEFRDNILKFFFIYIIDNYNVVFVVAILNYSLLLLIVTMNHMQLLFKLLQEDIKEIVRLNNSDIDIKIKRTIQRHSKLTGLLHEFGSAFGAIFAIRLFFVSFTFCFYTLAAKINKRLEDFKNVVICTTAASVTFYCCLEGEDVANTAQDIALVIYESSWENLSIKNKKILLFMMLRSQQDFYIPSTSLTNICLNSFIGIMKLTWSLISLFSSMYDK